MTLVEGEDATSPKAAREDDDREVGQPRIESVGDALEREGGLVLLELQTFDEEPASREVLEKREP